MNDKNMYEEIKRLTALVLSMKDEISRLSLQIKSLKSEMKGVKANG